MDLATTIFWIGVGLGALLVGIGVIMMALSLRPVARDLRALANDARRLTRLAESELTVLMGRTREIADGTEELTNELTHELDALKAQTDALERRVIAEPAVTVTASATAPEPRSRARDAVPVGDPLATPDHMAPRDQMDPPDPMGRQPIRSVQSPHAREDEQIP